MRLLRKLIFCLFLLLTVSPIQSQVIDPFLESVAAQVSYDTILANLQHLESLGVKQPGMAALNNTANWLEEKYRSFGYTNIVRDTFDFNGTQLYNIIITKPGSEFPQKYLIIDGHYDTYQGPGVNDNGSGVVTILEIARLLYSIPTSLTIRFIHFSGEEEGLLGSQHYVTHTVIPSNMNIALVLNIDEVGGVAGMVNNTITCERDESSPSSNNAMSYAYTDTLVNLTELYSNLQTQINYAYGSDYVPFQQEGEVITGLYESNESPYVHSPEDILSNMSPVYVTQVAKASTASALYFSEAYQLNEIKDFKEPVTANLFPNPAGDIVQWEFDGAHADYSIRIIDDTGSIILEKQYSGGEDCQATIGRLTPGMYSIQFIFPDGSSSAVKLIKTN